MADNPIKTPLPADLPSDWVYGQTVAPEGNDAGLSQQHGYNYLMQQVNAAQEGVNTLGAAFSGVPTLVSGKIPAAQIPIGIANGVAGLGANGKVPEEQLPAMNYDPAGSAATVQTKLNTHENNKSNPHSVTAAQVGARPNTWVPTAAEVKAAPIAHASTATTYGAGNASNYGHVKLSDSTSTASAASAGIAATPTAVKAAYDLAATKEPAITTLPVSKGGTGANTASAALTNLGAAAEEHAHTAAQVGAAPTAHASTATTYGAGSASNYGHVKLSDSTSTASGASEGIAATPTAVKAAYDLAASKEESFSVLPVSKGGTGATTEATARTSLGITPSNIGAAASAHNHAAGDITSGTLAVARGGTGVTAVGGTDYTTTRFRGSQLRSADTNPTTNGTINWTYE